MSGKARSRGERDILTAYRMAWMMVMFDLPVGTKAERKAASDFRKALQNLGFEMVQLSVYVRFCGSAAQFDTYVKKVENILPAEGKVSILMFTDRQYERIITFHGRRRQPPVEPPEQLILL